MENVIAHAELNNELTEQFIIIKKYYGIKSNADTIRLLITEKYREIKHAQLVEGKKVKLKKESRASPDQEPDLADPRSPH